jgi:hypothetical protein
LVRQEPRAGRQGRQPLPTPRRGRAALAAATLHGKRRAVGARRAAVPRPRLRCRRRHAVGSRAAHARRAARGPRQRRPTPRPRLDGSDRLHAELRTVRAGAGQGRQGLKRGAHKQHVGREATAVRVELGGASGSAASQCSTDSTSRRLHCADTWSLFVNCGVSLDGASRRIQRHKRRSPRNYNECILRAHPVCRRCASRIWSRAVPHARRDSRLIGNETERAERAECRARVA